MKRVGDFRRSGSGTRLLSAKSPARAARRPGGGSSAPRVPHCVRGKGTGTGESAESPCATACAGETGPVCSSRLQESIPLPCASVLRLLSLSPGPGDVCQPGQASADCSPCLMDLGAGRGQCPAEAHPRTSVPRRRSWRCRRERTSIRPACGICVLSERFSPGSDSCRFGAAWQGLGARARQAESRQVPEKAGQCEKMPLTGFFEMCKNGHTDHQKRTGVSSPEKARVLPAGKMFTVHTSPEARAELQRLLQEKSGTCIRLGAVCVGDII